MTELNPRQYSIVIASDHAGVELKSYFYAALKTDPRVSQVSDVGPSNSTGKVDYPDYAALVCNTILLGRANRGILICGSGIGMSMAANRHKGIRCALVNEPLSAELSRRHNDSNVLALGARLIGTDMAWKCVDTWLSTPFEDGRHIVRLSKF